MAGINISKQVEYALLGTADGLIVVKQSEYTILAYPFIDIVKQSSFPLLRTPSLFVAKQVAYALLRSPEPVDLGDVDFLFSFTLNAILDAPVPPFTVDFRFSFRLGVILSRIPPFDCRPQSSTTWVNVSPAASAWVCATGSAAPDWVCAADAPVSSGLTVLAYVNGDLVSYVNGDRIRLR